MHPHKKWISKQVRGHKKNRILYLQELINIRRKELDYSN